MTRTTRLTVVLLLNLALVAGLLSVGFAAHPLGVLAAGVDYLADAAAIGVSLIAIWLSRGPATAARPGGYPRAKSLAAMLNTGWLLLLCSIVAVEAVARLTGGAPAVEGLPILIVSTVAAAVMLGSALILGGDDATGADVGEDLNMRAVLLDTASDAAAAGGVAAAGAVILATGGFYWLDPAVALVIAAVIAYHAARLLKDVVAALGGRSAGAQV